MDLFESATIFESFEPVLTGQKISHTDIRKVLETASLAPSPYNSQPWEFVIVQQTEHIQQITSIVADAIDESDTGLRREEITDYMLGLNNLLIYIEDTTRQDPGENAYKLGLISMGTALANLILAASVLGIGIQPITMVEGKQPRRLRGYLKIPDKFRIHALFGMGYLKDNISPKNKAAPIMVHEDHYGDLKEIGELNPVPTPWDGFSLIKRRKSYRKDYLKRAVTAVSENNIIKSARDSFFLNSRRRWELVFIKDKNMINTLADLITKVAYDIHMDEGYFKKMRAWMRFTRDEKVQTADGVLIVMWSNLLGYILKAATYCLERFVIFKPFRALFVKRHSQEFFGDLVRGAPLIIVIAYNKKDLDSSGLSYELNTMSVGVGIQNMLLAATAQEMGAQFLSILVDTPDGRARMKELLHLPEDVEIVDLMRVGYIDENAPDPMLTVDNTLRRPVEKIAHVEFYQEFFGVLG